MIRYNLENINKGETWKVQTFYQLNIIMNMMWLAR